MLLIQMMEQQDEGNEDGTKKEVTLVQTVRGNYKGFTKQEVIKAREAREAQAMLGNPSRLPGSGERQPDPQLPNRACRHI